MQITRGLIIDSLPIDRILAGTKTWEMRSAATKVRGRIALIRKGSGSVVGTAEVVGCVGPLTRDEMISNVDRHQGALDRIQRGEFDKWRFAWVLRDAVKLARSVPYAHPSGAVIWVTLDSAVSSQLQT